MKIVIFDPYFGKFTSGIMQAWKSQGHDVRMDRYYNPEWAQWADVIWFDTCDNNLASATNPTQAILDDTNNYQPWDLHDMDLTGKRIIVRPIDIEVWQGHQSKAIWNVVNEVVFIAPHIRTLFENSGLIGWNDTIQQHTIPCGVDVDRYKFDVRAPGRDIAIVSEKWTSKGTDLILQIALELQHKAAGYRFHWLGRWSDHDWEKAYFEDFVKYHDLPFEFTEWLEGDSAVDEFLEGKNYLLHASHKEAFGYAIAEAMAKGIKPVVHRFFGADDLWPGMTWDSIDEAVTALDADNDPSKGQPYNSGAYRQYLIDHGYTLQQMVERINQEVHFNS